MGRHPFDEVIKNMKTRKILIPIIAIIMLVLTVGFAQATIDWSNDVSSSTPLWEYNTGVTGLLDLSSNGHDATAYGGVSYNTGKDAFVFDGVNDYVDTGYKPILGLDAYSLGGWIKAKWASHTTYETLFCSSNNVGNTAGTFLDIPGQTVRFSDNGCWGDSYTGYTNSWSDDTWHFLLGTYDGSNMRLYVDGVLVDTSTSGCTGTSAENLFIGARKDGSGVQHLTTGDISDTFIFTKALSATEITDLYNEGRNYNPFSGSSPQFSVTAKDFWSDASINSFWAYIDGTNYTTTNGTVNTALYQNDTGTYNLVVGASDYLPITYQNIAVDTNYEAVLHQSEISFNSFEIFTNNSISSCNYTINNQQNTTFYLNAGEHTVLAECPNYYAKNYTFTVSAKEKTTENITGIYDNVLNITVTDAYDSKVLSNFSGWIYNNDTSSNITFSTTGNLSQTNLLQGLNYTIYLSNPPLTYANNENLEVNLTSLNTTERLINYDLYESNSMTFEFYDGNTYSLLSQSVNATLESTNDTYNFNTSNGQYFLDNVTSGTYTLTANTNGFATATVFVTVNNGEHQTVKTYFGGDTNAKVFYVVNNRGDAVSGVVITFTRTVNGSQVVYGQKITDFAGAIQINLNEATQYGLTASKSGYDTFTGDVTPFLDTYTINIESEGSALFESAFSDIAYSISMDHKDNDTFALLNFQILSASGMIQYYGMNISEGSQNFFKNISGSPAGGTATINVTNITTNLLTVEFFFNSVNHSAVFWTKQFKLFDFIPSNYSLSQKGSLDTTGMSLSQKAFVAGLIIVVLVVLGLAISGTPSVGVLLGILAVGVMWSKDFLPRNYSLITIIVLTVLLLVDVIGGEL